MAGEEHAHGLGERLSVLIVDDNRDLADSLGVLMRLWGYDVCVAYDGLEGLQTAQVQLPQCLLLDVGMPGMDGYQLAKHVRQVPGLEKAKLIAHTAYSGEEHVRRMDEAGFDYRLTKPVSPVDLEGLLRMLEQVIKLAEQTEELARRNVELAGETKDLLHEVKQDVKELKDNVKEIKEELDELKEAKEKAEGDESE
jgi:two-component system OmpR family response regulator